MKNTNLRNFRGQAALEFALVFPLILLLILFTIDLGRIIFYQSLIHNAAREGARYAAVDPDATLLTTEETVDYYTKMLDQTKLFVNPSFDPDPCVKLDCTISVNIIYNLKPITPIMPIFLDDSEIHLKATSTMRIER